MMANVDGQPGVAWWTRRGGSRSGVSATVTHPPPFRAVWPRARRAVKTQNTREKGASDRQSASLAQFKASGEVKQQFVLFCSFLFFFVLFVCSVTWQVPPACQVVGAYYIQGVPKKVPFEIHLQLVQNPGMISVLDEKNNDSGGSCK